MPGKHCAKARLALCGPELKSVAGRSVLLAIGLLPGMSVLAKRTPTAHDGRSNNVSADRRLIAATAHSDAWVARQIGRAALCHDFCN